MNFYNAIQKFLSDPIYKVLAFIFVVVSVSVTSTWYILEKTRIEPLKEDVLRFGKLLDQKEKTIESLKDIIKDLDTKSDQNSHIILNKSIDDYKTIKKNNLIRSKLSNSSEIIDKIKSFINEGNKIKKQNIQEDKTYENFIRWRESVIEVLLSLNGDLGVEYSNQFKNKTSLSLSDYPLIPNKITVGLSILNDVQNLVQEGY